MTALLNAARASAAPLSVPGEILVKPRAGVSETDFLGKLKRQGGRYHRKLRRLNVRLVSVPEGQEDAVLASLRHDPDIEFAERDYIAQAAFLPGDPYVLSGSEWHLAGIQALSAWDLTAGSSNIVVAVLDSGIDSAHPDLSGQVLPGYDFVNNDSDTADDLGHGTAVSGTIAAAGNNGIGVAGVAYGCRLLPVKVMDSSGFASYSCIAQGIKYAVDQGARVINISIVGNAPSSTLQEAIDYAWTNNVLVVAAAGNNADDTPQYPAACNHVVAVSATEADDSLAWFSSYGPDITLAAPGDAIWTTQNDLNNPYGAWRGTSLASPIVAGVAALAASVNPSLSNARILSLLEQTADDIGSPGYDPLFGYGQVNAFQAVLAAGLEPGAMLPAASGPAVSLSSPADSESFSFGEAVPVAANASAGGGASVTNLVVLANGLPLAGYASDGKAFSWTPTQPGSYSLTAVATDDRGLAFTSAPVVIQVLVEDTNAPVVAITHAPRNGARLTAPQISVAGTALDNGDLRRVEIQVNNGPNQTANGTTQWDAEILLTPGRNVVHVRSVDWAGNVSPEITRTYTCVLRTPLTVRVNGMGTVSPHLDGRALQIGRRYRLKAIPRAGQAFAGWNGVPSASPVLEFVMQSNLVLTANFVPSPFPPVEGGYAGLMIDTNGISPESSGFFAVTMTRSGRFSGKLLVGGKHYGFHGRFDLAGDANVTVRRGKLTPLAMILHVDLSGQTERITGSVTGGGWASELAGDRNVFNARKNPALQAGAHAFVLERTDTTAATAGTGSSVISRSGRAHIRGRLEGGPAFTAGSALARNGDCPFYLSLDRGSEVVIGWLNFPATPTPTADGTVAWVRSGTNAFAATLRAAALP